jgi:hypothetical protein
MGLSITTQTGFDLTLPDWLTFRKQWNVFGNILDLLMAKTVYFTTTSQVVEMVRIEVIKWLISRKKLYLFVIQQKPFENHGSAKSELLISLSTDSRFVT